MAKLKMSEKDVDAGFTAEEQAQIRRGEMTNIGGYVRNKNQVKAVKIKCTVTLANGDTKSTVATIGYNKINQLGGNGLTSKNLYDLRKHGRCESEYNGTKFTYQIVIDEPQPEYAPTTDMVAAAEGAKVLNTKDGEVTNEEAKVIV